MNLTKLRLRVLFPMLGVVLLAAFVWQSRQVAGAIAAGPSPAERGQESSAARGPGGSGIRAEGRLVTYPGAQVTVGTDLGGTIARLVVAEKDAVRRGQLIAEIDAAEQRAALAEARARVAEVEADLRLAEVEVGRTGALRESALVSQQSLDRDVRDRDAARARYDIAAAAVRRLEAVVAKARIIAPLDGVVISRAVEPSETVSQGDAIVT
ncbi:MAG: efflux RND transporter periplasmic adaptor subunit, partial [Anaerolineales bacterium]